MEMHLENWKHLSKHRAAQEKKFLIQRNCLQPLCRLQYHRPQSGYISHIQCDEIGVCSLLLGGGRETKDSVIDLSVGLELKKKVGDYVEKGETLAVLHANDQEKAGQAEERFLRAYRFSGDATTETSDDFRRNLKEFQIIPMKHTEIVV